MPGLNPNALVQPVPQGGGGGGGAPLPPIGDPNLNRYVQYYNDLIASTGGQPAWGAGADLSGINRGVPQEAPGVGFPGIADAAVQAPVGNQWDASRGVRDMTTVDKFFANVGKLGESIVGGSGFTGFGTQEGLANDIARFATSLPAGIVGSPFSGLAHSYEGVTKRPVTEGNLETGQMPGDDLTGFQQLGSLGLGLTEVAGPLIGGEAEAISAAWNAGRAARGLAANKSIGLAASRFMGRGAGAVAVDTAEEAGEEAFQSVMEDVRYDRLDEGTAGRALEGAVYGALGGAIMSAGGQMVNSALGSDNNQKATSVGDNVTPPPDDHVLEAMKNREHRVGGPMSASAASSLNDKFSQNREQPTSANQISSTYSNNIGLLDAHVGTDAFLGIMQSDIKDSAEGLAKSLGTTVDELKNVYHLRDEDAQMEALNDLLRKQEAKTGRRVKITVGRTPDSNDTGVADFYLTKFVKGNQIGLNRAAYTFYRSDTDGDQMMLYLNPHVTSRGFLTRNMHSKVVDKETFDTDFANFFTNTSQIKSARGALGAYQRDKNVWKVIENVEKVIRGNDKKRGHLFATEMSNLVVAVERAYVNSVRDDLLKNKVDKDSQEYKDAMTKAYNDAEYISDEAVASYWDALEKTSRSSYDTFEQAANKLTEEEKTLMKQMQETILLPDGVDVSSGNLSGVTLMELFVELGMQIEATTGLANPFFRQFGEHYYPSKMSRFNNMNTGQLFNAYSKLIAIAFRMGDVGLDVQTAIEGVFRMHVVNLFNDEFAGKITTGDEDGRAAELEKAFAESYNKAVDEFNKAWEDTIMSSDWHKAKLPGAPVFDKKPLKLSGDENFHVKFMEVMGERAVSDLVQVSDNSNLANGVSWNMALEAAATMPMMGATYFTNMPKPFRDFWRGLLKSYGSKTRMVGSRITTSLDTLFDITNQLRSYGVFNLIAKDGSIDNVPQEYYPVYAQWVDGIVRILGIEYAERLKMVDLIGILDTTWGKEIVAANRKEDIYSAVISARLSAMYKHVFDGLQAIEDGDAGRGVRLIQQAVGSDGHANISELHMAVYDEWASAESLALLDTMTDLQIPWEEKVARFDALMAKNVGSGGLVAAAFKTDESILTLSALTNDLKKADRALNKALYRTRQFSKNQVDMINAQINGNTGWTVEKVVSVLKRTGRQNHVKYSEDTLTSIVMSGRYGTHAEAEKGMTDVNESMLFQFQAQAQTGTIMSAFDRVNYAMATMEIDNLVASREAIITVLTDRTARIRVFDPETGNFCYLTQEKVFRDYGFDKYNPETGATADEFWQLISEHEPQLLTLLTPQQSYPAWEGSDGSMKVGMAEEPYEAINRILSSTDDKLFDDEVTVAAQNFLLNQPGFGKAFIMTIDPDAVVSDDFEYVKKCVRSHMKKWVDYLKWYASLPESETIKDAISDHNIRKFNEVFRSAEVVLNRINEVSTRISVSSAYESARDTVADEISQTMIAQSLVAFLEDNGISVGDIELGGETEFNYNSKLVENVESLPDIFFVLMQIGDLSSANDWGSRMAGAMPSIAQAIFEAINTRGFSQSQLDALNKFKSDLGITYDQNTGSYNYSAIDASRVVSILSDGLMSELSTTATGGIVLERSSFMNMTGDEAVAAIDKIARFCHGEFTWTDKERKKVKDSFDKNETDSIEEYFLTFNNAILHHLLLKSVEGTALTINLDVGYSAASAAATQIELARDFHAFCRDNKVFVKTNERTKEPPVKFTYHAENPVVVAASTNVQNRLDSASIGIGIGVDAGMTKVIAASGAFDSSMQCGVSGEEINVADLNDEHVGLNYKILDSNEEKPKRIRDTNTLERIRRDAKNKGFSKIYVYRMSRCLCGGGCAKCAPASRNPASRVEHKTAGNVIATMMNFMMEEMHLKRKKAVGMVKEILQAPRDVTGGLDDVVSIVASGNAKPSENLRNALMNELVNYRVRLTDAYMSAFGQINGFPLGREDAQFFANLGTPYFEIGTATNEVIRINVSSLETMESFDEFVESKLTAAGIDVASITNVMFSNISLNEVAAKIIRNISSSYMTHISDPKNTKKPGKKDFYKWAEEGAKDWSDIGELSSKDIFSRIPEMDMSLRGVSRLDYSPTAMMRWNEETMKDVERIFDTNGGIASTKVTTDRITVDAIENVKQMTNAFKKLDSSQMFDDAIAGIDVEDFGIRTTLSRSLGSDMRRNDLGGYPMIEIDGEAKNCVEIIAYKDAADTANKALSAFKNRRHCALVPASQKQAVLDKANDSNGSSKFIATEGYQVKIGDTDFVVINYMDRFGYDHAAQNIVKSPVSPVNPNEDFTWIMVDEGSIGTTDAQLFVAPDAAKKFGYVYTGTTNIHIDKLFKSSKYTTSFEGTEVLSKSEIMRLAKNGALSKDSVDVDFYTEAHPGLSEDLLRDNVQRYLANINSVVPSANHMEKVQNGDCLGFMKRGDSIVPVFYIMSGAPSRADTVSFGIDENRNLMFRIRSKAGIESGSYKFGIWHISYKAMGTIPDQKVLEKWPMFLGSKYGMVMKPDMIANNATMIGRVWGKGKNILFNNLYTYSLQFGANILYDFTHAGHGENVNLVGNLKKGLNSVFYSNDQQAKDLITGIMDGDPKIWGNIVLGNFKIFEEDAETSGLTASEIERNKKLNQNIANVAAEIYAKTNNYRIVAGFFTPRYYNHLLDPAIEGDRKIIKEFNRKLRTRMFEPNVISKNLTAETILSVFNAMDDNFCPPDLLTDAGDRVFDENGYMAVRETTTDETGKKTTAKKRVMVIGGPHYFTEQAGELKDYSRGASFSMQSVVKSMLEVGVYNRDVESLVSYLSAQVGDYGPLFLSDDRDPLKDYNDTWEDNINKALHEKVKMNTGNPMFLKKQHEYRTSCLDLTGELHVPIRVNVSSTDPTFFLDDPFIASDAANFLQKFNDALQISDPDDRVSMEELLMLVKYQIGYSYNSGEFTAITYGQFKMAVDLMIKSIENNEVGPMLIDHNVFRGGKGDKRVPIVLLLPDIAERIFNASERINDNYSSVQEWQNAQYELAKTTTMREIAALSNKAKSIALRKMMDATAYANGFDQISGHISEGEYIEFIIEELRKVGPRMVQGYDIDVQDIIEKYDSTKSISKEYLAKVNNFAEEQLAMMFEDDNAWGGVVVNHKASEESYCGKIARNLVSLRQMLGVLYIEMPIANGAERLFNQGTMSVATHLGTLGSPLYKNTKHAIDPILKSNITNDKDVKTLWAGLREAQLLGMEAEFIAYIRDAGDVNAAINEFMSNQGRLETFRNKLMNIASAKDFGISGQIGLFLERFAMRIEDEAPWWGIPVGENGETVFQMQLRSQPVKFIIDILNGSGAGTSADAIMSRQCFNWALRGDMAQKNLASAIYAEIARRSAGASLFTTAFLSPYFNYATNRFGRLMQWVLPVSSIHHVLVKFFTEGHGKGWKVPGLGETTFGQLVLEDVQLTKDMKEACLLDTLHLGPTIVACMLLGIGALEPPEDEDKWGNFKEWTIFGARVDANWWIEDILGLALPYAAFGASVREGKPRYDLIVNGLTYYLSNNPVVKVSDAVEALFDPFAELEQAYENDFEGYKKAMGGPPTIQDVWNGRLTSFGLSMVAQFITPGILREIYNQSQQGEVSYKRIFQEGQYGKQTEDGEQGDKTQYTTYQDAMLRKYTKNNPIMGFLADQIIHPETGYMAHEMPRNVIYDPFQMNAMEYFSIYNDPFNRMDEKTDEEKDALAVEAIGALQTYSIEELKAQGFALDYETKEYISKVIWDTIAGLNNTYNEFLKSDAANNYYWGSWDEGRVAIQQIKEVHYATVKEWERLYYDKLWSKELTLAKYYRRHTTYATDDNGEVYATGMYPQNTVGFGIPFPFTLGQGESQGEYQENMGREMDWQSESIVTGKATGQRALVPLPSEMSKTPDIESWSTDGTDTGYSDRAANKDAKTTRSTGSDNGNNNGNGDRNNSNNGNGSRGGYARRSGGGGGYARRSGGGGSRGGGGSGAPNIYSRVNPPNLSNPDTMRSTRLYDAQYDALRPDFQTKGSREAYKRSDI